MISRSVTAPWLLGICAALLGFLALSSRAMDAGASPAAAAAPAAPPAAVAVSVVAAPGAAPAAADPVRAEATATPPAEAPAAQPAEAGTPAEALVSTDEVAPEVAPPVRTAPPAPAPAPPPAPAARASSSRAALGPMAYDGPRGRYVASYGGRKAVLSLSPKLQTRLEKLLSDHRVPVGAAVLLEPRTGRVLAMAEHVERGPAERGSVALRPVAPAASIFKIVTGAALLERGVAPDAEVCFHGGNHRIQRALLADDPRRDRRCLTLSAALGKSANVVFAKLAGRGLRPDALRVEARRFLFDAEIPFAWPVQASTARIPEDRFELATTAAGFGPVRMSPLHGALLASIVANRGVHVPPRIVDAVDGGPMPEVGDARRVLRADVAAALARMMRATVTEGTARKVFARDRWARRSPLHEVAVAGKTGSLADASPYRDYSWFVGFAPAEDPQVAVAAVVVNERLWRIKASLVAHEALSAYFAEEGVRGLRTASR